MCEETERKTEGERQREKEKKLNAVYFPKSFSK
jgi:hypothetical protein